MRASGLKSAGDEGGAGICERCSLSHCSFRHLPIPDDSQVYRRLTRGARLGPKGTRACLQFWIVMHGTAATCTVLEDGRRQILGLETTGDVICGEMSGPGGENWVEALDDCLVCEIDLSAQAESVGRDSGFMMATFGVIHRRMERALRHVATLGRLDSRERVMLFLAEMALRHDRFNKPGSAITLPTSREDMADFLGLNAETISRILGRLRKSGLVRFLSPTEYVIPDMAEIARRLPVDPVGPPSHLPALSPQTQLEISA